MVDKQEVLKTDEKADKAEEEEPVKKVEQETEDNISKANAAAARLEAANKELARLTKVQERLEVEQTLSGKTTAGTKRRSKDEIADENARKMLEGTGFGEDLFPTKE